MLLAVGAVHHHLIRAGRRMRAEHRRRDRRGAGRAPARLPDRLRRQRGQPLPGLRDVARARPGRAASERLDASSEVHDTTRKAIDDGPAQDHVEDGHLDAHQLPRRADLRGDRPGRGGGRALLHRHRLARRRHRPARDRARDARAATPTPSATARPSCDDRGFYRFRRDGEYHAFNPTSSRRCTRRWTRGEYGRLRRRTRRSCQRRAADRAARPAPLQAARPAGRRSTRSSRSRRSCAASPRRRCRSARSARRRTRRSRSA